LRENEEQQFRDEIENIQKEQSKGKISNLAGH